MTVKAEELKKTKWAQYLIHPAQPRNKREEKLNIEESILFIYGTDLVCASSWTRFKSNAPSQKHYGSFLRFAPSTFSGF